MGPSISVAALTTASSAIFMIFCKSVSFQKFATIMIIAIFHSTIRSFFVYLVLVDIFGPAESTKGVDRMLAVCMKDEKNTTSDELEFNTARGELSSIEKKITCDERGADTIYDLSTPVGL